MQGGTVAIAGDAPIATNALEATSIGTQCVPSTTPTVPPALTRPAPVSARSVKHGLDRILSMSLLVLLLPVLCGITVAVALSSRGPVLFRQRRVGLDGSCFTMIKFRTMRVGAERQLSELLERNEVDGGVLFKLRDDPRVTRVGRVLRRLSLDELPQLFNVLGGSMSLVGPRPPLPEEVAQYGPQARRRLSVRPGLTGLWQVSGRSDLSWEESLRLDLSYVDQWSLALDAQLLLRTVGAVFRADGAY